MSDPTNQYKHPVYPVEATRRGEIYALAHGYILSEKGIVYQQDGKDQRTYRGFYRFYFSNRVAVDAWLKQNGITELTEPGRRRYYRR
jgi:hypothetical protein